MSLRKHDNNLPCQNFANKFSEMFLKKKLELILIFIFKLNRVKHLVFRFYTVPSNLESNLMLCLMDVLLPY